MEKNLLDAVPATSLPRERMLLYGEKALSDQELLYYARDSIPIMSWN